MAVLQFHNPNALSQVDDYVTNAPLASAIGNAAGNFFAGANAVADLDRKRQIAEQAALDLETARKAQVENYYLPADTLQRPMQPAAQQPQIQAPPMFETDPELDALAAQMMPSQPQGQGAQPAGDMTPPPQPQLPFPAPLQDSTMGQAQGYMQQMGPGGASLQGSAASMGGGYPMGQEPGLLTRRAALDKQQVSLHKEEVKEQGRNNRTRALIAGRKANMNEMSLIALRKQSQDAVLSVVNMMHTQRLLGQPLPSADKILQAVSRATNALNYGAAQQLNPLKDKVNQSVMTDVSKQGAEAAADDLVEKGVAEGDPWYIEIAQIIRGASISSPDAGAAPKGPQLTPAQQKIKADIDASNHSPEEKKRLYKLKGVPNQ